MISPPDESDEEFDEELDHELGDDNYDDGDNEPIETDEPCFDSAPKPAPELPFDYQGAEG